MIRIGFPKSGSQLNDHFAQVSDMVNIGPNTKNSVDTYRQFAEVGKLSINVNGGKRIIKDYKLSRYACYLGAKMINLNNTININI